MNPITPDEGQVIIQLFLNGENSNKIASKTGRSSSGIYHYLKRNGFDPNCKDIRGDEEKLIISLADKGESVLSISKITNRRYESIFSFLKRKGYHDNLTVKNVSSEEAKNITCLYRQGKTIQEIADDLKRSYPTIKRTLIKNGIDIKQEKEAKINERNNSICSMYLDGQSITEISKNTEYCAETISNVLKQAGIEIRTQKNISDYEDMVIDLYNKGFNCNEIGKIIEMSGRSVSLLLKSKMIDVRSNRYTQEDHDSIISLYTVEKLSCSQIANILGKSPHGIVEHIKSNGIEIRNNLYSDTEKNDIIRLYKERKNPKEIATIIGRSRGGVWKYLNRKGCNTSRKSISNLNPEEIEDICTRYENLESSRSIGDDYNLSDNTIISILDSCGVQIRRPGVTTPVKHENFFEIIDTEEKAYILGLLISDGYVIISKRENHSDTVFWGLTLQTCDKYMLELIKDIIGLDNKKIYHARNEYSLTVTSKKMVNDLAKYGVVPRKCKSVYFPYDKLDKSLYRHLIRGIFDGDGCISKNTCSFTGNNILLPEIQNVLVNDLGINRTKITTKKDGVTVFAFSSKTDVSKFFHYLYDDSTIYLKRKYEKFLLLDYICTDNHV